MATNRFYALFFCVFAIVCLLGCGKKNKSLSVEQNSTKTELKYAKGFSVQKNATFTVIEVTSPWPSSDNNFKYALVPKEKLATITFPRDAYDAIVPTPVEHVVLTSTTHIPSLEALGVVNTIIGFPSTDFISSPAARKRIENGQIKELGTNENINTEIAMALQPDVVIGFGINDTNKAYEAIKKSGIPVAYNGDWVEQTPLGKAEWIKFFAPFFQKETLADSLFHTIEKGYLNAKQLAQKSQKKPTVLTGGLYKDVWYVAGGKSWMAQFLQDANTDYLWANTDHKGSIGLSLEVVLDKAQKADYWLNPSMHITYKELQSANAHHQQFEAFKQQRVFSNAIKKGAKGGLLFYELAPQRPDLVLKDLIAIMHPLLLPDYEPHFFMPLE
ncbi:ABC transporter substrate-binding protein [Muricauda sp. JGD-17]|uniref:ABC transporter substrate-binding protein n=1 Tax=Flagellimonas ochracea TaxID=2696472 RepID=A0A964WWI2_9FLAO|nr:ABC transporter substrate-binding protein [Allomuricauda ochracea]NAY90624.1 ABC transporter substrate-binding protein [Allomuricauda ochracea]